MFVLNWPNFSKVRSVWRKKIFRKNLFSYFGDMDSRFPCALSTALMKKKKSVSIFSCGEPDVMFW